MTHLQVHSLAYPLFNAIPNAWWFSAEIHFILSLSLSYVPKRPNMNRFSNVAIQTGSPATSFLRSANNHSQGTSYVALDFLVLFCARPLLTPSSGAVRPFQSTKSSSAALYTGTALYSGIYFRAIRRLLDGAFLTLTMLLLLSGPVKLKKV